MIFNSKANPSPRQIPEPTPYEQGLAPTPAGMGSVAGMGGLPVWLTLGRAVRVFFDLDLEEGVSSLSDSLPVGC